MSETRERISRTEVAQKVRGLLIDRFGATMPMREECRLSEHGFSRVTVAVLVAEVEYAFSVRIPEFAEDPLGFADSVTLGQLIDLIEGGIARV